MLDGIDLAAVFARSPDLIAIHTSDGVILASNDASEALLGQGPEGLRGQSLFELVHSEDVARVREHFAAGEERQFVYRIRRHEAGYVWFETNVVHDGNRVYTYSRDVSARAAVELLKTHGGSDEVVNVCAWTGRIRHQGEWLSADRYLQERLGVQVSHGIAEDVAQDLMLGYEQRRALE
ncbi:MAG: PAS domain-containing protein [Planctomycetota bacterium]|jgi:PAS domain S-box-containing protein|nr:PAS domain-containing protein [Planctomycetota bacterium]